MKAKYTCTALHHGVLSTRRIVFLLGLFLIFSSHVFADVTITPASNGTNISADRASNALSPSFTVLGDIVISENVESDFNATSGISQTIILTAPDGWQFNTSAGTVAFSGGDISSVSISVSATEITIFVDVIEDDFLDAITISGIEVQALDGSIIPHTGHIYRSSMNPGGLNVTGIISTSNMDGSGGTDFGELSQMVGNAAQLAFTTQPGLAVVSSIFGQQPVVITQDQFGHPTTQGLSASQLVSLALSTGTGVLSGTTLLDIGTASGNGSISYSNLQVSAAGVKRLMASSPGLLPAETNDFTVSQAATSVSFISDINPACPSTTITLTASVTPASATGTVEWYDGVVFLGAASITAGEASLPISTLTPGSHNLTAVYTGDPDYTGSSSVIWVQVINPAIPLTPGGISGAASVCPITTGNVYSISPVADANSYTWTVPAGWTINSGQGSLSISVTSGISGQNGSVTVAAVNSCGTSPLQSLSVLVNPSAPAMPGSITGPSPVCPNTAGLIYSVLPVPNATTYDWTLPAGWVLTSGSGTSSVTITSGATGGNITVTASNGCGTSGIQSSALAVNPPAPSTPGLIIGPAAVCPNVTGIAYSVTSVANASSYSWTVPAGWVITAGAGTNAILVTSGVNPGNISVSASNSCGSSGQQIKALTVNAAAPATPGSITGLTPVCPNTSGLNYSINPVVNATSYNWTLPAGWTISAGAGTNAITVTSSSTSGNISVSATNSCGTSSQQIKAIIVSPASPATPGTISGPSPVCPNVTGLIYSIAAVPNATSYNWTLPAGWTITSGSGTNSITVTSGSVAGTISVSATGLCGTSTNQNRTLTLNPATPATPTAISGPAAVCPGITGISYSIAAVAGASSYNWSVPAGWSITAGAGTTTLTVTSGNSGQNGSISVTATNSCGTSSPQNILVTVSPSRPASPGAITGPTTVCAGTTGVLYSVAAVANATSYTWSFPAGWTITAGVNTQSVTVTAGANAGTISVAAVNSCGSSDAPQVVKINPQVATNHTGWTDNNGPKTSDGITVNAGAGERRGYMRFPLNSLPVNANISSAVLKLTNNSSTSSAAINNINALDNNDPVTASAATLYNAAGSGTTYNSSTWPNTGSFTLNLNAAALADIQADISSQGWIAMGLERGGTGVFNLFGYSAGANAPELTVNYTSVRSISVAVNPPAPVTPGTITGSATVCSGIGGITYSINSVANATSYTWTVPAGWTINSGQNTTSVSVTAGAAGNNGNITVTASNSCGTSSPRILAVTVIQSPTTSNAGSNQNVCTTTSSVTLGANTPAIGTGAWSVVSGPNTSNAQFSNINNPSALFTRAGGAGTYQLRWTITNGSCTSQSTVNIVFTNPPANPNISFNQTSQQSTQTINICGPIGGGGQNDIDIYNYNPPGGSTFQWQYSSNGGPWTLAGVPLNTTQYVISSFGGQVGTHNFQLIMTSTGGCVTYSNIITLTVNPASSIGGTAINACGGVAFNTGFTGFPSGTTYTWTTPAVTGGMTGGSSGSGSSLSGTLNNNSGSNQTATYTVTPVYPVGSNPSCAVNFPTVVTVRPRPSISTSATASAVCFSSSSQTGSLAYSATNGSPTNYSITWNGTPANSFTAVNNAALPASPIGFTIPANTNAGTYTGNLTVTSAAGCTGSSTAFTVTVNAQPNITLAATAAQVCYNPNSQNTTLTYSAVSGSPNSYSISWNGSPANSFATVTNAALPASPITITVPAGTAAGTYTGNLTVRNGTTGCVSTTKTFTLTVLGMPNAAWSASAASVCTSSSSQTASLTYASASNSPNSYSITWSPVPANSFANLTNVAFPGSAGGGSVNITVPANTLPGTYTGNITVRNAAGCVSSPAHSFTITVGGIPAIPAGITGIMEICEGVSGLNYFIAPVNLASSYNWTLPSGWTILSGSGTQSILVNIPIGSASGNVSVAAVSSCGSSGVRTLPVQVNTKGTWLGQSADWNDPDNWCGGIPTSTTNVTIPSGTPNDPVISTAVAMANHISILPGGSLFIDGNTLQVAGNISSNAGINALNGHIELNGQTAAQSISGSLFTNHTIRHLTISNNQGVSLSGTNDTLKLSYLIDFGTSNATLQTNGNLTLLSRSSGTASVGDMTSNGLFTGNNITGDVTVERFIPNHPKAWQFLSVPTKGQTINQAWQEGNAPLGNNRPGYGIIITGNAPATTVQGFDIATPAASGPGMKTYNPSTGLWEGVPSTFIPIANPHGYMVFVRGDRSVTAFNQPATSTILRSKGQLYTIGADAPPSLNLGADQFLSVGNPYASAIDFSKLNRTGGVQDVFYVWDPKLTSSGTSAYGLGAYQTFVGPGPNYMVVPGGGSFAGGNTKIESGMSFFVHAFGTPGTLSFSETAKVNGSNLVTRQGNSRSVQQIKVNLSVLHNGTPVLLDGALSQFDRSWSSDMDGLDVVKLGGLQGGEQWGIVSQDAVWVVERRAPIAVSDTIQYRMGQLKRQQYRLEFELNQVSSAGLTAYLEDRYLNRVTLLNGQGTTVVDFVVDNQSGSMATDRFRIFFRGRRMLEVSHNKSPGNEIVKEQVVERAIEVVPNPVTDGQIRIRFAGFQPGLYSLSLISPEGQKMMGRQIRVTGEKEWLSVKLPANLGKGYYDLVVGGRGCLPVSYRILVAN